MKNRLLNLRLVRHFIQRRGTVVRDEALCVFCGLCAKSCPMGAVTVHRETRTLAVDSQRCVRCGGCVKACPKKALHIQRG